MTLPSRHNAGRVTQHGGIRMLLQLGYVSTATGSTDRAGLLDILETARGLNHGAGVTGLLLFYDGHFMQLLEGEEHAVRDIFGRIAADPRHRDITVLFEEPIDERLFTDWTMGFQRLDGNELLEFPVENGAAQGLRAMAQDAGRAKQLLLRMRSRGLDPRKDIATTPS